MILKQNESKDMQKEKDASTARTTEYCRMIQHGTQEERESGMIGILAEHNSLINYVYHKHYPTYRSYYEDLYSAGKVGLLQATRRYDSTKSRPSTYFSLYIRHEMYMFVVTQIYKIKPWYAQRMAAVKKCIAELEAAGVQADPVTIASHTNLSLTIVDRVLQMINLSDCERYGHPRDIDCSIFKAMSSPEDEMINASSDELQEAMLSLSEKERIIIIRWFGLDRNRPKKKTEIAAELSLTTQKVQHIFDNSLKKLRQTIACTL